MKHLKVTFFFLVVSLTLSGCGIFGGSDGTDVSVAEDVAAQPTVNNVQAIPADGSTTDGEPGDTTEANAALPTAVTLPTAAPTPAPTVDRSQPTTYIVQSGDVLGLIAERFDVDIAELRRVNNLDGNLIRVGQELTIPALDGSTTTESASGSTAATTAPAATSAPSAPSGPVSCTGSGYCIQPGDSLTGIAVKNNVTVDALRAANPGLTGDFIRSGEVLNLPGGAAPSNPSAPAPSGTTSPIATVGPATNADCAARNADFPYFHAADGLCYANPIGGATAVPTAVGGDINQECRAGFFLWEDGLCYPIPGVTVTPTAGPTATGGAADDYGRPPCRDGYVVLVATNKCWPEATNTSPATVTPSAASTTTSTTTATTAATTTSGNTVACAEPNFTLGGSGTCFLLQAGLDAGCFVENGVPKCP